MQWNRVSISQIFALHFATEKTLPVKKNPIRRSFAASQLQIYAIKINIYAQKICLIYELSINDEHPGRTQSKALFKSRTLGDETVKQINENTNVPESWSQDSMSKWITLRTVLDHCVFKANFVLKRLTFNFYSSVWMRLMQ